MVHIGEPIAFTFIFKDRQLVFSTDRYFLVGVNLETNRHYSMAFDKCFASCLDFTEDKGVLIAGLSNNVVAMINPRKERFKILRTFLTLTSYPPLAISFVDGMQKIVLSNIANEIILVERKSKKSFTKYESRMITRLHATHTVVHALKIIQVFEGKSSVLALISVDKVRLIWVDHRKKFQISFLQGFIFSELGLKEGDARGIEKASDDEKFFKPDILNKSRLSFLNPKKSQLANIGFNELKLILKKKNQNLMSRAGVCILGNKFNFKGHRYSRNSHLENLEWFYLILTFENRCSIYLYSLCVNGQITSQKVWNLELQATPIWGCFMGKNSLLFLFDNFDVSIILLNQLDNEKNMFHYGELPSVGVTQKLSKKTSENLQSGNQNKIPLNIPY